MYNCNFRIAGRLEGDTDVCLIILDGINNGCGAGREKTKGDSGKPFTEGRYRHGEWAGCHTVYGVYPNVASSNPFDVVDFRSDALAVKKYLLDVIDENMPWKRELNPPGVPLKHLNSKLFLDILYVTTDCGWRDMKMICGNSYGAETSDCFDILKRAEDH